MFSFPNYIVANYIISNILKEQHFIFSFKVIFSNFFFFFFFLAASGLHCCSQAFSNCGERVLLFVAVHGLLIVVASLVVGHGL